MSKCLKYFVILLVFPLLSFSQSEEIQLIENGKLILEVGQNLSIAIANPTTGDFLAMSKFASGQIETRHSVINSFKYEKPKIVEFTDSIGKGRSYMFSARHRQGGLNIEKQLGITIYDNFPHMAVVDVSYLNHGKTIYLTKWKENNFNIPYQYPDTLLWSFQGSSTNARKDWIRTVTPGYFDRNFMGMNSSDYGGGIPVCDVWRRDAGIAIGHLEMHPLEVSFPVDADWTGNKVNICMEKNFGKEYAFADGDELKIPLSFVSVHSGDCFSTLRQYSKLMQKRGITFPETEEASFEPVWCAWGYERGFTLDEIIGTLPKVKELGFKWAVLDDGYQQAEGDWNVNTDKFPGGEEQMKDLVDKIHSYGLKAKLWYAPLAIDPNSKFLANNRDVLLFNEDWSLRFITWWDAFYMSPSYEKTRQHTLSDIKMFMEDWGFDGLKLDGQHMNAVPADYNPELNLENPEQSVSELPDFFKIIYKEARNIKKDAVVENCPCGCCMSFFNMPSTNQFVSSDPLSSWQIRLKGKVYKALAPNTAYYGDHVELSDDGIDFASTIGIGGVPGSKFTWPKDNPTAENSYLLTSEKEAIIKKWIDIYYEKELAQANYLGDVYDIGFDKPETHLIKKDNILFYSFYDSDWDGKIELKGLDKSVTYRIHDYVNDLDLGTIDGNMPYLNVKFKNKLLIEVFSK